MTQPGLLHEFVMRAEVARRIEPRQPLSWPRLGLLFARCRGGAGAIDAAAAAGRTTR